MEVKLKELLIQPKDDKEIGYYIADLIKRTGPVIIDFEGVGSFLPTTAFMIFGEVYDQLGDMVYDMLEFKNDPDSKFEEVIKKAINRYKITMSIDGDEYETI